MFGYVLPRKDKLSEELQKRYRAAYCGLCHALKLRYGFHARFLVNYDMTFLYFLLQGQQRKNVEKCLCPARPFCKKDCLPADEAMDYAADLSVLLSWWKLQDAKQDGDFFHRLAARGGLLLYGRCYRKAAHRQTQADEAFRRELSRLARLEQEKCPSIDQAADAFASLLQICARGDDPAQVRVRELLLYHVGRYLYLVDALEDLPKDIRKNRYNPLRYRYQLNNNALSPEDRSQLLGSIDASISMAASALELLPKGGDSGILENIIYYGLPAVLQSVEQGSFRKRGTRE